MYLPHFAFPLAASKGEIPRAQEVNAIAAITKIKTILFMTCGLSKKLIIEVKVILRIYG
jgi:hypothetical protein